jgi:glutamate-1-semialdehyde 2,1-aminomutase
MAFRDDNSRAAYQRAKALIPGGVNSPVRAALAVGREPIFIASGHGSHIRDVDGNRYIDYVGSWGPLILGHTHPEVVAALCRAANSGMTFGAPTERETALAEEITVAYPSMEMVRLVNSGTEATMSAIRLARGVTGRDLILKFEGCYHGHTDALLVKAGSGALTMGVPSSLGVPAAVAATTLIARYNDLDGVRDLFATQGEQIAAVIVEPIAGNMGVVLPAEGFLFGLSELTRSYGSLLIVDEVMTGFRVAYGGAQAMYGLDPDLTCLGKISGGGLPLAAYGGKRRYMEKIAPLGPVYQAGTLSGNPLAVAAGLATIRLLQAPDIYDVLERRTDALATGIRTIAKRLGLPVQVNRAGSMFSLFFTENAVTDYAGAASANVELFARHYRAMLEAGIYVAPSQFEALFVSTAHCEDDIHATLEQVECSFARLC